MNLTAICLFQITVLKMNSIATRVESVFHLPTNVTISQTVHIMKMKVTVVRQLHFVNCCIKQKHLISVFLEHSQKAVYHLLAKKLHYLFRNKVTPIVHEIIFIHRNCVVSIMFYVFICAYRKQILRKIDQGDIFQCFRAQFPLEFNPLMSIAK